MHNLERQMFERFLWEKNYLSPNSNVVINDINKKVTPILNQFSFLEKIPTSYFRVHFNLILPSLSIEELYEYHIRGIFLFMKKFVKNIKI